MKASQSIVRVLLSVTLGAPLASMPAHAQDAPIVPHFEPQAPAAEAAPVVRSMVYKAVPLRELLTAHALSAGVEVLVADEIGKDVVGLLNPQAIPKNSEEFEAALNFHITWANIRWGKIGKTYLVVKGGPASLIAPAKSALPDFLHPLNPKADKPAAPPSEHSFPFNGGTVYVVPLHPEAAGNLPLDPDGTMTITGLPDNATVKLK